MTVCRDSEVTILSLTTELASPPVGRFFEMTTVP